MKRSRGKITVAGCDAAPGRLQSWNQRPESRNSSPERNGIAAAGFDARRDVGDQNVAISDFRDDKFARCHADAGDRSERFP